MNPDQEIKINRVYPSHTYRNVYHYPAVDTGSFKAPAGWYYLDSNNPCSAGWHVPDNHGFP